MSEQQEPLKVPCICCSHPSKDYNPESFTGVVELTSSIGYPSATKLWLVNGKKHREDGPAVERPNGTVEYWLFGNKMTKTEWEKEIAKTPMTNKRYFDTYENPTNEITEGDYRSVSKNRPDFTGWATFAWWDHKRWQGFYENGKFNNLMGPALVDLERKFSLQEFWVGNKQYYYHDQYFKAVVDKVPHVEKLKDLKDKTGIYYCKETDSVYLLKNGRPTKNLPGFPNVLRRNKYNASEVLDEENGLNMERGKLFKLDEYLTTFETKPRTQQVKDHGKIYGYEEVESNFADLNGWISIPWFYDEYWTCHFTNGVVSNLMGPAAISKSEGREFWVNGKAYSYLSEYFKAVKNTVEHYERLIDLKESKHTGVAYCKETDKIYLLKNGKPTKNIAQIPYNTMDSFGKTEDLDETFSQRTKEEEKTLSKFTQEVWKEYLKGYKVSTKVVNGFAAPKKENFTGWARLNWCNHYTFFVNGEPHNEAGPATFCFVDADASEYWLNGKRLNEQKYFEELGKLTKVYDNTSDIPNQYIVIKNSTPGRFLLYNGGKKIDNVDGLPNSFSAKEKEWRNASGELHRLDGPAVVRKDGSNEYWINGILYSFQDWKQAKKSHVHAKTQDWDKTLVSVSETARQESCCFSCGSQKVSDGWVNYGNGEQLWHFKGRKLHNLAGPAIIRKNGTHEYWIEGRVYTRNDYLNKLKTMVPWIENWRNDSNDKRGITGTVYDPHTQKFSVFKDGKLFVPSKDDPYAQPNTFYEEPDGVLFEYRDAKEYLSNRHGPARVYTNGTKEYWIDGKRFYFEADWKKVANIGNNNNLVLEAWLKKPDSAETPDYYNLNSSQRATYTGWVKSNGNYYFLVNGKGHCDFGAAVLDGSLKAKEYRINGETKSYKDWFKIAVKNLKEYEYSITSQKRTEVVGRYGSSIEVFVDGKRQTVNKQPSVLTAEKRYWEDSNANTHREDDLPAIENENGDREWYKNGALHRDGDLPAKTTSEEQRWYKYGRPHRDDNKPAIVNTVTGVSEWFVGGRRHREDGPAWYNEKTGECKFWLDGSPFTNSEYENRNPHKTIVTDDPSTVVYGKVEKRNKETDQIIMTSKLLNGKLHCVTGPAVTHENGDVEYWINGKQYSEKDFFLVTKQNYYQNAWSSHDLRGYTGWAYYNGHTRYYKNGKLDTPPVKDEEIPTYEQWNEKFFYKNGKLVKKVSSNGVIFRYNTKGDHHSPDNNTPAFEAGSQKHWYKNGELHREDDLPAKVSEYANFWYKKGIPHRTSGPAVVHENGEKEYWVNGENVSEDVFYEKYATVTKDGTVNFRDQSIPKTFTGTCLRKDDTYVVVNGTLHSETAPAFVSKDGKTQKWYLNGKPHRENGPAVILSNGEVQYWVAGKLHRLDGPAIIRADGTKEYWIDGKLHSNKGAAKTFANGIREYIVEGKRLSKREWQKLTSPISNDAKDAAYRVARNQLVKVVREFLADEISKKTSGKAKKEEARNAALEFLSSEVGVSVVFGAIGILLPKLADKLPSSVQPHLERLNKEFRVSAMATVGNEAVNLLTSSIVLGKTKEILSRLDREAEQKITIESVELIAKPVATITTSPAPLPEEKAVVVVSAAATSSTATHSTVS